MHSRQSLPWCQKQPEDCMSVHMLCDTMESDHHSMIRLQQKYPKKLKWVIWMSSRPESWRHTFSCRAIRFEDLALNPREKALKMMAFLDIPHQPHHLERFGSKLEDILESFQGRTPSVIYGIIFFISVKYRHQLPADTLKRPKNIIGLEFFAYSLSCPKVHSYAYKGKNKPRR